MTATHAASRSTAAAVDKAAILVEALPWLARFSGCVVVVKYGGHAMGQGARRGLRPGRRLNAYSASGFTTG